MFLYSYFECENAESTTSCNPASILIYPVICSFERLKLQFYMYNYYMIPSSEKFKKAGNVCDVKFKTVLFIHWVSFAERDIQAKSNSFVILKER